MEQFYIFHNCILIDDIELLHLMPAEKNQIVSTHYSVYFGDGLIYILSLN